jgi:hypothetical protein
VIARLTPIAGVLLLFPLSLLLDYYTPPPPNVVETLPPAQVLPVLASGHRETMAAMLELRAVSFVLGTMEPGQAFSDEDRDHLFLLYQGILTLDPDDAGAALRGSVLLSAFGWRADASLEILEMARGRPYTFKGEEYRQRSANPAHPAFWKLWFEEAGIYLSMRANEVQSEEERNAWIRKAGQAWITAEEMGASPGYGLRAAGERLTRRGLDRAGLLEREQQIWEQRLEASPEEVRPQIEARVNALVSLRMALALNADRQVRPLADELHRRGQRLDDIRRLTMLRFPPEALVPPSGGTFEIIAGQVVCPEAEAFLLEQSLTQSFKRLRKAQPTRQLTLVDLGWIVPPFADPLEHNPLFRVMGWYPVVVPPKKFGEDGEGADKPWWEILPKPVEPQSALGLKPVPYLRYWIEGDRVRVAVAR